jgi:hypothetical protein
LTAPIPATETPLDEAEAGLKAKIALEAARDTAARRPLKMKKSSANKWRSLRG